MSSRAFTPSLVASPRVRVSRIRELPVPGEITVNVGDTVHARDIVAKAELPGELFILRLPERMGLQVQEIQEGLKVKEGERLEAGQVIAEHSAFFGLLTARFEAPEAGTVEFIAQHTMHLGLRLPPNEITLDAYIPGEITKIEKSKSVTISNDLCFIQGIFGVGGERKGPLSLLPIAPHAKITDHAFQDPLLRDAICVGGGQPTLDGLKAAEERGIAGLICGSIDDKVLAAFLGYELGIALTGDEDVPFTIIVTEGFGDLPLSERVIKPLEPLAGCAASINGKTQVRAGAVRPELLVDISSQPVQEKEASHELTLDIGASVRLLRVPYFGQFAEVVELPIEEEKIPTGATTRVLRAKLKESGEVVTVPRANIELV